MPSVSARGFVFTLNNPVRDDIPLDWFSAGDVVYVAWQVEEGKNGTRHLQGYFITKENPKNKRGYTASWCKTQLNGKMHIEVRNGTHEQARAYATKEDTRIAGPWEYGEWKSLEAHQAEAGERIKKSTLTDVKHDIDSGMGEKELYEKHFTSMLRYKKAFDQYKMATMHNKRNWPFVIVLWGPPGTGKSMKAEKIVANNGGGYWWHPTATDTVWFDGYDPLNHPVVVFDDFKGNMPYSMLLRILDRYPMAVGVKGSTVPFNPKLIVITSNEPPNQWYFQKPEQVNNDCSALLRRLEGTHGCVIEMKDKVVIPGEALPNLKDVFDLIEDGTYISTEKDVRDEYLSDVSRTESVEATKAALREIDLTCSEEIDFDDEEWDDVEEVDDDYVDDNYVEGIGLTEDEIARIQEWEDEREHEARVLKKLKVQRSDSTTFGLETPKLQTGHWKPVGTGPVQSKIVLKRKATDDDDNPE